MSSISRSIDVESAIRSRRCFYPGRVSTLRGDERNCNWYVVSNILSVKLETYYSPAMVKYAATGYHLLAVLETDPSKAVLYAKLLVAETIIYLPCVSFPRLAILLVYLKIFTSKPYRIACYTLGVVIILQAIIESFLAGFECIPLEYIWDKTIPGGRCFNTRAFWAWGSFPNIMIDLTMIILPMQTVVSGREMLGHPFSDRNSGIFKLLARSRLVSL